MYDQILAGRNREYCRIEDVFYFIVSLLPDGFKYKPLNSDALSFTTLLLIAGLQVFTDSKVGVSCR